MRNAEDKYPLSFVIGCSGVALQIKSISPWQRRTLMGTHSYSSIDTLCQISVIMTDCSPGMLQNRLHAELAEGAGLVLLSTLMWAALCEGLSATCCCPHQSCWRCSGATCVP